VARNEKRPANWLFSSPGLVLRAMALLSQLRRRKNGAALWMTL
jgi:hypothetical protein